MNRPEIAPKYADETVLRSVDFTDKLAAGETINTKTVSATVYSGTDASPSSLISGSATSSGAIVSQVLTGGNLGVLYELLWQITTSASRTLQKSSFFAIVPRT